MQHHAEIKGRALLFLLFLWYLWFIVFTMRAIFSPVLPLIEDEFAITHARASSIFIFQSAGYALSVFFSGFYSSRIGYKRSIVFLLFLSSLIYFLIPFTKTFSIFYVFSFVQGFTTGVYLPSAIPLITEYFAEKNWGKSIIIHDTAASISIFCTPFIVLFLLNYFQWRGIFGVFAIISLASAIVFSFTGKELKIQHPRSAMFSNLVKDRSLWIVSAIFIATAGANMGLYSIVPLYLTKELSFTIGYANTLLGISRFGGIGVAIVCGFLIDEFNIRKILFMMLFLTGVFTVLMATTPVRFTGIFLFFQAIFVTGLFPIGFAYIARIFAREERSMATGLVLTFAALAQGILSYLLGLSGDLLSFRFGIGVLGILVILTSFLVFRLKKLP